MRVWLLLVSVSAKCGDELEPLKLDPVDTLAGQVKGVYEGIKRAEVNAAGDPKLLSKKQEKILAKIDGLIHESGGESNELQDAKVKRKVNAAGLKKVIEHAVKPSALHRDEAVESQTAGS